MCSRTSRRKRGELEHKLLDTFSDCPWLQRRPREEATRYSHWLAQEPRSLSDPVDSMIERSIDACSESQRLENSRVIDVHGHRRDARETAAHPGPDATHVPEWRRSCRVRTSADDVVAAFGEDETRARIAAPPATRHEVRVTAHPSNGATSGLDTRRWTVRVRRCAGTMHGARVP